jgi:lipopolysaccharide transport system permease protein
MSNQTLASLAKISRFIGEHLACAGLLVCLYRYRGLIVRLLRRDIISRTSGTLLGAAWMVIQPGLQVLAFWFLLGFVLKVKANGPTPFLEYFLVAMLPWLFIQDTLTRSLGVLSEFGSLYQRTIFPVAVIPFLPIGMSYLVYTPVYMVVAGLQAGIAGALKALVIMSLLGIWLLPWAYLLSIIGVFIRESRQIVPFMLTMAMYVTPILYQPAALPESIREALSWNVLADIVALVEGWIFQLPVTLRNLWQPGLLWLAAMPCIWLLFRRSEPHLREEL